MFTYYVSYVSFFKSVRNQSSAMNPAMNSPETRQDTIFLPNYQRILVRPIGFVWGQKMGLGGSSGIWYRITRQNAKNANNENPDFEVQFRRVPVNSLTFQDIFR